MNIIFTMFLSSNILFLLYTILNYFHKDFFSIRCKYILLKIVLAFALIPWAYLKTSFVAFLNFSPPLNISISGKSQAIMFTPKGTYANKTYQYHFIIICIWFLTALIIVLRYLWKQLLFRHKLLKLAHKVTAPEILNILNHYQSTLKLKRRVSIYCSTANIPPFTMGIINPIILIPHNSKSTEQKMIIHHELCHIKKHDGFFRFIRLIVIGIYWFNPLVYILDHYLECVCELSCDELVTKGMDQEQLREYAYLLVNMAISDDNVSAAYITPFSTHKKPLKERIEFIMKKKEKRYNCAVLVATGLILCSSFPVFAYQSPTKIVWENSPQEDIFPDASNQTVVFKELGNPPEYTINIQPILYSEQFIDYNGNIYHISKNALKATCEHMYVDGTYQKHTKNSDGSCITKSYSAQRCSKCGTMKIGTLINEIKYTSCPH